MAVVYQKGEQLHHIDNIDDKCEAYIKKEADDNFVIDVVNCLNLLRVYLICIDG